MTRKRWLVLLVFLAALGTLAWLALMPRKPVEVPQPAQAGAGVHGTVLVRSVAQDGEKRRDAEVVLPDFVVSLKDAATNQVSEQVKTDLFGRYRFPPQKQGTYKPL